MSLVSGEQRQIPIIDPKATYAELRAETERAVLDVLESGHYALSDVVTRFEENASAYLGTTRALGVSSGTESLLVALSSLGVGPGDEVITTAFSFIASATSVARVGARPVFVDIDPDTYQMDTAGFAAAVTDRTRAVIAVHLYGHPAPMEEWVRIAEEPEDPIAVIEDAAQAIGSECRFRGETKKAGAIGVWGCYSFYATKNLAACGEAGLMVTSNAHQFERARQLRNHGMDAQYHHVLLGGNARIDAIQAAILDVRLRRIDAWNERRRENAARYRRLFEATDLVAREAVRLPPPVPPGELANYHQFTLRVRDRDGLVSALRERGVSTGVYYPLALPFQPVFADLGHREGDFPHAEQASREVVSLPIHPYLGAEDLERVVAEIERFYR